MTEFKVAFGENRQAKKWKNGTITLEELRKRLSTTFRTAETQAEYQKMKSAGRSAAKDKGGFVGGVLATGSAARLPWLFDLNAGCGQCISTFLECILPLPLRNPDSTRTAICHRLRYACHPADEIFLLRSITRSPDTTRRSLGLRCSIPAPLPRPS